MAGIELSSPAGLFATPSYEHVARAGDFAFVAGQVARDETGALVAPGDAAGQAARIYGNIGLILAMLGAGREQVVKITTFLVDRADSPAVTRERQAFFGDHRPPHTGLIVAGLGGQEVRLEVEIVVYCPRDKA